MARRIDEGTVTWIAIGCALALLGCEGPAAVSDAGTDAGGDASACGACDDGLFCNGVERCERGACVAGEPPCDGECDETAGACDGACADPDADGDGHDSLACGGDDCDDADAGRYPGNAEVCDPDDHDEDCRPDTYGFQDLDGDGYPDAACCNEDAGGGRACGDDCHDMRAIAHPHNSEVCDGIDNDCDGAADESVMRAFHPDADGDGFGDASAAPVEQCDPPSGHVEDASDCDDANPYAHSATAPEVCDRFDNDCDGVADEETGAVPWYLDTDMDLFGDAFDAAPVVSCLPVAGRSATGGDCDDSLPTVHPTAAEVCNEIDDDCDGPTDEGVGTTFYRDADRDGQGRAATTVVACAAPAGYVARGDDCDDTRASTYVGAPELCNALDDDCSSGGGLIDTEDADRDGHAAPTDACSGGLPKDDCDDTRSVVSPGASTYHDVPIECGYGSAAGADYAWCATRRCCVRTTSACTGTATCDSVSAPRWDYDCTSTADRELWVTGSCQAHPSILGECIGEGPVGSGTPPACGTPVSYRVCTRAGLTGPCTASTMTAPLRCR